MALLGLGLAASCGTSEQKSDTKFQVGGGNAAACTPDGSLIPDVVCMVDTPGHEIITRQALRFLDTVTQVHYNEIFKEVTRPEDPPRLRKASGFDSLNPIVRGNYAQDKILPMLVLNEPLHRYLWEIHGTPIAEDWQNGPNRQKYHALRDFRADTKNPADLDTALQACRKIQNIFHKNAEYAIEGLKKSKLAMGQYMTVLSAEVEAAHILGATTHTLQDTFSQAHVRRNFEYGSRFQAIQDICKWGKEVPGVCRHGLTDTLDEDVIWANSDSGLLKPESTIAANTTGFYLLHVYRAYKGKGTLDAEMNDFYKGSPKLKSELMEPFSKFETGLFDCLGL